MATAYILGVMTGRSEDKAKSSQAEAREEVAATKDEPQQSILKPHELEFTQVLRGEKPKEAPQAAEPKKTGADIELPAPQPDPIAYIEPGIKYDFSFQVAALKDEQAVDSLREKLEDFGLRTRMERSGKMYLVMVLMRADAARVAELLDICKQLRLGEPLLRSKKAVEQ